MNVPVCFNNLASRPKESVKGLSQKSGTEVAMAPFATRLERRNPLLSRLLKDVATSLIASGVSQKVKNRPFGTPPVVNEILA
jgi:hypothetical protein